MKYISFFVLLIFVCSSSFGISRDSTQAELASLLKQRKELADSYYASLEKKSGFFGNKTKNDLRDSQEKLVDIVKADNKIMEALNRTLNFRNFEKINMRYDVNSFEDRTRNLSVLNDTLSKQNVRFLNENKIYRSTLKRHTLYFAALFLLLIFLFALLIKKYFNR